MKIIDIKTHIVKIRYHKPEIWSLGVREGSTPLILEIFTDEGITGVGEGRSPISTSSLEFLIHNDIKPLLIGEDPFNIERISKKIFIKSGLELCDDIGVYMKSGIDIALWDIIGKKLNVPLYKLIGGKYREKVEFGYYLFRDDFNIMISDAKKAMERGFRLLKFKVGIYDAKDDVRTVKVLREALGPNVLLFCDANQAWSVGTAIKVLKQMEDYDIFAVEQPTARKDFEGQKYIRNSVNIPISINEGVYTAEDAYNIISHGCADIIATDIHRPGGIMEAKKLAGIAEAAKISVIGHSGGELDIATAAYLHFFSSTPNFIYPNDSYYYHFEDFLIKEPFKFEGPYIKVPEKPGLGIELDYSKLEKYKSKETFNPFDDREKILKSEIPIFPKY